MPKQKCCIRNSRRRRCTKRNMCPRKKCKTVYLPIQNQVQSEQPEQFFDTVENFTPIQQPEQFTLIQQPEQRVKQLKCTKERKQIRYLVNKLNSENKKIDELWDKLANAYEFIDKSMESKIQLEESSAIEKKILNTALEGLSNEQKQNIERLYQNVTDYRSKIKALKWSNMNQGLEIKNLKGEITKLNQEYKVFIKKLKLILKNKIKALEIAKMENENATNVLKSENDRLTLDSKLKDTLLKECISKSQIHFDEKRIFQSTLGRLASESKKKIDELKKALKDLAESSRTYTNDLKQEIEHQKQEIEHYKLISGDKNFRIKKLSTKFGKKHISDYQYLNGL
jgi:hypothetical protein